MSNEIFIGILSFCGTVIGTVGGILASSKLTIYRIEQLEKKVEKHNGLVERMFKVETKIDDMTLQIDRLERQHA